MNTLSENVTRPISGFKTIPSRVDAEKTRVAGTSSICMYPVHSISAPFLYTNKTVQ